MDVKRAYFIENVETTTYRLFVCFNIFNLIFHIVKITGCVMWMYGFWNDSSSMISTVNIMNEIWVISLSTLLLVTGVRFLMITSQRHVEGYMKHKNQTIIMMVVLVVCEMSSVYYSFFS